MKIHINSRQGLYEVERFGRNSIMLSTKHNSFSVPCSDFKSFAGGLWNHSVTKDEMDQFLSVVRPEEYKFQVSQEDQILTLASRLDIIQAAVKAQQLVVVEEEEEDQYYDHDAPTYEDYKSWYERANDKADDLDRKMRNIARKVYSQNLDFTHFQVRDGIKFIIQQDHVDEHSYRFCWDPYGFVSNGHSDISSIYHDNHRGTINGGWLKIIDNNVILYAKSGDYGVYDDTVAIECAKKIFPTKQIHSFAGQEWDEKLNSKFDDLPF